MQDHVLSEPILHISGYFETYRNEQYCDRLRAVRERGEIDEWIQFFAAAAAAAAVEHQANESAGRIRDLLDIRERYRAQVRGDRSQVADLIERLLENPVVIVSAVVRALNVTQPTGSSLLHRAEGLGWVRSAGRWARGGKERWAASEIWRAVTRTVLRRGGRSVTVISESVREAAMRPDPTCARSIFLLCGHHSDCPRSGCCLATISSCCLPYLQRPAKSHFAAGRRRTGLEVPHDRLMAAGMNRPGHPFG